MEVHQISKRCSQIIAAAIMPIAMFQSVLAYMPAQQMKVRSTISQIWPQNSTSFEHSWIEWAAYQTIPYIY